MGPKSAPKRVPKRCRKRGPKKAPTRAENGTQDPPQEPPTWLPNRLWTPPGASREPPRDSSEPPGPPAIFPVSLRNPLGRPPVGLQEPSRSPPSSILDRFGSLVWARRVCFCRKWVRRNARSALNPPAPSMRSSTAAVGVWNLPASSSVAVLFPPYTPPPGPAHSAGEGPVGCSNRFFHGRDRVQEGLQICLKI